MNTSDATHLDFIVGELVCLDGRRQSDAAHMALLTPPRRAHRDRRRETVLLFLDLGGGGAGGLARAMLEQFSRSYWRHSGPLTSALRQAIGVTNEHLRNENRLMPISQRRRAGLICAVLRDNILYLAHAGPAKGLLVQGEQVIQFPQKQQEKLPLGISSGLDIQFSHTTLNAGDRLLLTGDSWTAQLQDGALAGALSAKELQVEQVMLALERQAGNNPFSALVVECAALDTAPSPASRQLPSLARPERSVSAPEPAWPSDLSQLPERAAPLELTPPAPPRAEPGGSYSQDYTSSRASAERRVTEDPAFTTELEEVWRPSIGRQRLDKGWQGLRRAGLVLGDGARAVLTRILPEPEPTLARRQRRAKGSATGNVPMMAGIAVAIPLIIAFVVVTFYLQRNETEQRKSLMNRAIRAAEAARQTEGEEARGRWEAALQAAEEALVALPEEPDMLTLRTEARETLDALGGAVRPELIPLWDYGAGQGRRLATSRMQVYVLDTAQNQVTRHTLNQSRQSVTGDQLVLVAYRGQRVGEEEIGGLRDMVWLSAGNAWTSDALFILTDDNRLLQHSPSWGLSWMPFDVQGEQPEERVLRSYDGKLYVLDPQQSQVWRFRFNGDGFDQRESYFSVPPPDLSTAVDMAIDGAVYVLLADGQIFKFFGGQAEPFELGALPLPLVRPVALVSEGDMVSGALYVADADAQSIVALTKTGAFIHQIQADGEALANLEALAIDMDSRTLYVLANGRLYAVALPALPELSGTPE
jgi:hypothetical protein